MAKTHTELTRLFPARRRRGRHGLRGQRAAAALPPVFLLRQWTRIGLSHSATSLSSQIYHRKGSWTSQQSSLLQAAGAPSATPDPSRVSAPRHLPPTRGHTHADALDFLFLHETVSQSKVPCCCCYCLTVTAALGGNFTAFGGRDPRYSFVHKSSSSDLLVLVFP